MRRSGVDGRKRVDANLFENGAKQLRFRVDGASENRNSYIVWKLKNK